MDDYKQEFNTLYHFNNYFVDAPLRFGDMQLAQIGRRYCGNGDVIPKHVHRDWFELTLATGGSAAVYTDDEPQTVTTGDIYLSFPHEFHEIRVADDQTFTYDFVAFSTDAPVLRAKLDELMLYNRPAARRVFRDEKIGFTVRSAMSEFGQEQEFRDELLQAALSQILIYILRDFSSAHTDMRDASDADILCYRVMHYIDTHIYTLQSLTELGEEFNYNYSYLSALFKKTTHRTPVEYLSDRKLETARLLLTGEHKKVSEVAAALNYSSAYAFSKAFKAKYGYPPKTIKPTSFEKEVGKKTSTN